MFFFLHGIIVEKIVENHHKLTSDSMDDSEIKMSMNIFYVIGIFVGSIRLLKDILNLIFDHRTCIWLHRIYEKKHLDNVVDESKEEKKK
jgi:hypothetical protein